MQLLQDLRRVPGLSKSSALGIDTLDELLDLFRAPPLHTNARQPQINLDHGSFHNESRDEYENTDLEYGRTLSYGLTRVSPLQKRTSKPPIVSISTEDIQSHMMGLKTALLDYLTALCVLPLVVDGISLLGKGQVAVYLDSNERFSAVRLARALQGISTKSCTAECASDSDQEALRGLISDSLKHVHVYRPQSSSQLIATLRSLPSFLLHGKEHASFERSVGLIVLDSADAFYWQDRVASEKMGLDQRFPDNADPETDSFRRSLDSFGGTAKNQASLQKSVAAETVRLLRQLQRTFECTVVFTTGSSNTHEAHSKSADNREQDSQRERTSRPDIPAGASSNNPWDSLSTMPLVITPSHAVPQFPPSMSIDQCIKDRNTRGAALLRVWYAIRVDWTKSYDWGPLLKTKIQELERNGRGQALMHFGVGGVPEVN